MIVSSAGVIWVSCYRVISDADEEGKMGRSVITSLRRRMRNRGVINNLLVPPGGVGDYLSAPLPLSSERDFAHGEKRVGTWSRRDGSATGVSAKEEKK